MDVKAYLEGNSSPQQYRLMARAIDALEEETISLEIMNVINDTLQTDTIKTSQIFVLLNTAIIERLSEVGVTCTDEIDLRTSTPILEALESILSGESKEEILALYETVTDTLDFFVQAIMTRSSVDEVAIYDAIDTVSDDAIDEMIMGEHQIDMEESDVIFVSTRSLLPCLSNFLDQPAVALELVRSYEEQGLVFHYRKSVDEVMPLLKAHIDEFSEGRITYLTELIGFACLVQSDSIEEVALEIYHRLKETTLEEKMSVAGNINRIIEECRDVD